MATLLIWHGYLLGGTGSNIYSANIVESWVRAGHDVLLMCQEPHPELQPSIHEWELVRGTSIVGRRELAPGGVQARREAGLGSCRMVQADIGGLLPVYLLDRYEGFVVKRFVDLDANELASYEHHYQEALRGVLDRHEVDGAVLNHAVMGPPALRPVLEQAGVPYTVKIHGSELEYCIAEDDRFVEPAREGLRGAVRILVGSGHIASRMDALLGEECSAGRVELLPPGVDLDLFQPAVGASARRETHGRLVGLLETRADEGAGRSSLVEHQLVSALDAGPGGLVERLADLQTEYEERDTEVDAPDRIARLDPVGPPMICYVGKLIRQKGVHLLIAAMPLVLQRLPAAQLLVVGFGNLRDGLGALVHALARGDGTMVDEIVAHGAQLDGGPDEPLHHLRSFLDELSAAGELADYFAAARELPSRVRFTGQVDHAVLANLWPLCRVSVVPSIAAEAFGMVSAEAAACGCPPVVAHHSGLADVADAIGGDYPAERRHLVSFNASGTSAVRDLAHRLVELCELSDAEHAQLARSARETVEREWSWSSIAERVAAPLLGHRRGSSPRPG